MSIVTRTVLGMCLASGLAAQEAGLPELSQTWIEIDGQTYGAKPNALGPIGGGTGYTRIVTDGDYRVRTVDELIDALKKAKAGQVVYIEGDADIDCTTLVFAEKLVLKIPGGVTLASNRGHEGSPGGIIYSDAFATRPLMETLGPKARLTGLRLRGPDPKPRLDHHRRSFKPSRGDSKQQHKYYYAFPVSEGIRTVHDGLEVDNCEVSGWSHAAIHLSGGKDHHVHHCYIHHNQMNGLGYGVCHGYSKVSVSLVECNIFDYNRHSIAGTGKPGNAYEARHNVELGQSISHNFDMHGGRDRRDGTVIAGDWLKIHHNTFLSPTVRPIAIRGVPRDKAEIHHNWFGQVRPSGGLISPWPTGAETHVELCNNAYGIDKPALLDIRHETFEQASAAAMAAADRKRYRQSREHAKAALELAKTGQQRSSILALVARCCEADKELSGAKIAYEQILRMPDATLPDKTAAQAGLNKIAALTASKRVKDWKLVFSDDFERPSLGKDWASLSGKWRIAAGKLACGELSDNQILLTRSFPGFQRVEFDALAEGKRPCDLSTFIHSGPAGSPCGYFLQFGGSGNTFNSLRRDGVFTTCQCEKRFITPGKVHKIVAEFDGAAARLTVDGQVVLEYLDAAPVLGAGHDKLGFYIYTSGAVDNVRVYSPAR